MNFPENETAGGVVFRVSAEDEDEGRNGEVTYALFGHEAKQWFQIDSITGNLFKLLSISLYVEFCYYDSMHAICFNFVDPFKSIRY